MSDKMFTSRTAVLTYKTCAYKRLLQFHTEGSGLVPAMASLDLLNGTCVHRGIQHLLEHCRTEHPNEDFEEACVDEAVEEAREIWKEVITNQGIALKSSAEYDRLEWIIAEQECLWEGLIRAFAIRRLPVLLEEYEILEVEHEEVSNRFSEPIIKVCDLCTGTKLINKEQAEKWFEEPFENLKTLGFTKEANSFICPKCEGTGEIREGVIFLGKADGLFLRKSDNKLIILSIKTTSECADVTTRDILHDMQGVSEWFLVEERLAKLFADYKKLILEPHETFDLRMMEFEAKIGQGLADHFRDLLFNHSSDNPKVFAVQYEYLIKGKNSQEPYKSGIYKQKSFLCHPLKFDNSAPMISWGFQGAAVTINPDLFKWSWGAGKYKKGWEKCDIWNEMSIKQWINMLATGEVQPEEGHPFDKILRTPDLIVRSPVEIEEWLTSTRFQEENIAKYLQILKDYDERIEQEIGIGSQTDLDFQIYSKQQAIWQYFPKNTLSCHNYFGRDCSYVAHCHELEDLTAMRDGGILVRRRSHHEAERLYQIEKGLVDD